MLNKEILEGAYDLHIHSAPDIVKRKADDLEIAKRITEAGMKGYVSKSHYALTVDRVNEAKRAFPDCNAMGSIVLNASNGGINPFACEHAARLGAKVIWFPTMDSPEEFAFMEKHAPDLVDIQLKLKSKGLKPKDICALEDGILRKEAKEILSIAKDYDIVVGTGHISHGETIALAKAAKDINYKKLVITHVNLSATRYSAEEQKQLIELGATIERSYVFPYSGRIRWEEEVLEIKQAGAEHCILSTDLGRPADPFSDEGMLDYANQLFARGISESEIKTMIRKNTARLVE